MSTDSIIELRTYRIAPGRRPDFDAHFRDNSIPHLQRMGIRIGEFWDHPDDPETISYTVVWSIDDDPAARWAEGAVSPPWVAAKEKVNANGPLILEITSVFLAPRIDMVEGAI